MPAAGHSSSEFVSSLEPKVRLKCGSAYAVLVHAAATRASSPIRVKHFIECPLNLIRLDYPNSEPLTDDLHLGGVKRNDEMS